MTPHKIWFLVGLLGIFVAGAVYGSWVGATGKRNGWSGKRIRRTALLPFSALAVIAILYSFIRMLTTDGSHLSAVFDLGPLILCAGFLALFVAAKRVGVPVRELETADLSNL
jgi:hypothetical protein